MQEAIDLKNIIAPIWKAKKMILAVTITSIAISGVYSKWIKSPVYQANTTIMIAEDNESKSVTWKNLVPYANQAKNDYILNNVHKKMLESGITYSVKQMQKDIIVDANKETNFINIKARGANSSLTSQLTNTVALELASYIEISAILEENVGHTNKLHILNDELSVVKEELAQTLAQFNSVPEKLTTIKALADDPFLLQTVLVETGSGKMAGGLSMTSEEINPIYIKHKSLISDLTIKEKKIAAEIDTITKRINDNQKRVDYLQNIKMHSVLEDYKYYHTQRAGVGFLIIPAIEPVFPLGSNVVISSLIVGMLVFLMLSIFVYFRTYLLSSGGIDGSRNKRNINSSSISI